MIKIKNETFNFDISKYILGIDTEQFVFFDIETTGLNALKNCIYMIGYAYIETGIWKIVQLLSDDGSVNDESEMIVHFSKFLNSEKYLVSFNGDSFDLKFISKRAKLLDLDIDFNKIKSLDIYRHIKKYKNIFSVENYKLKTLERFMGIYRSDELTGFEAIDIYNKYVVDKQQEYEDVILLHNRDDIYALVNLSKLIEYTSYIDNIKNFDIKFEISNCEIDLDTMEFKLILVPNSNVCFDLSIKYKSWICRFDIAQNTILLSAKIYFGQFYHFYDDFKQYCYVPKLDEAIHKSIAQTMDKKDFIRANKKNCYIKKEGYFIKVFEDYRGIKFVNLSNRKDIYTPIVVEKYKYLDKNNFLDLANLFFKWIC